MTLKIVDVASHQGSYKFGANGEDGLIVKATQGTGYVNPYCDGVAQQMINNGKPWGIYHYAGGSNAQAEAKYFINNIKNYLSVANKPILILDWESYQNSQWGNGKWASDFIEEVKSLTGIQAGIYTGSEGVAQTGKYLSKTAFLWFAGYPTVANVGWSPKAFPYAIKPWSVLTGWQFSSTTLDKSLFYLDTKGWKKLAGNVSTATPSKPIAKPSTPAYNTAGKTIDQMANDVLAGKVGSGDKRAKLLGKFNTSVQALVNARLGAVNAVSLNKTLANEVKKGVFGTGDTRKKLLATHYNAVQAVINKTTARHTYYTVKAGDSWWSIANKYKVDMNTLAKKNDKTIKSVIHPGDKLLIK